MDLSILIIWMIPLVVTGYLVNISVLLYLAWKFCQQTVDSDQMPHFAASELGLHCLHMSPKQVSSLKRVIIDFSVKHLKF